MTSLKNMICFTGSFDKWRIPYETEKWLNKRHNVKFTPMFFNRLLRTPMAAYFNRREG